VSDPATEDVMHYSEPDAKGCLRALVLLGGRGTSREIRRFHDVEAPHTSVSRLREYLRRQGYQGETVPLVWLKRPGDPRKRPVYVLRRDVLEGLPADYGGDDTAGERQMATNTRNLERGMALAQRLLFQMNRQFKD